MVDAPVSAEPQSLLPKWSRAVADDDRHDQDDSYDDVKDELVLLSARGLASSRKLPAWPTMRLVSSSRCPRMTGPAYFATMRAYAPPEG